MPITTVSRPAAGCARTPAAGQIVSVSSVTAGRRATASALASHSSSTKEIWLLLPVPLACVPRLVGATQLHRQVVLQPGFRGRHRSPVIERQCGQVSGEDLGALVQQLDPLGLVDLGSGSLAGFVHVCILVARVVLTCPSVLFVRDALGRVALSTVRRR